MNITLRIFVMAVSVFIFATVIHMLIRKKLNESNSVLWLFIALVTLGFGFFPKLLNTIASLIGIEYAPTLLFLAAILTLFLIVFRASLKLSEIDAKVSELVIEVSILKAENKRLVALSDRTEESNNI